MNYRSQIVQDDMERMFHQIESKEKLYNTTVLITGASGMLATYMTYYLMYLNEKDNANIHVLALVRNEEKAWKKFADFKNEEQFELCVIDDGVGFDISKMEEQSDGRQHIGVRNARIRFQKMCNGTVDIYSEKGKGTKIRINLPKGGQS